MNQGIYLAQILPFNNLVYVLIPATVILLKIMNVVLMEILTKIHALGSVFK